MTIDGVLLSVSDAAAVPAGGFCAEAIAPALSAVIAAPPILNNTVTSDAVSIDSCEESASAAGTFTFVINVDGAPANADSAIVGSIRTGVPGDVPALINANAAWTSATAATVTSVEVADG